MIGIRMSMRTTSGRSRRASSTPARPSAASPIDLEVRLGAQDHPEAGPEERLVVDDEDPDHGRVSGAGSSVAGPGGADASASGRSMGRRAFTL